MLMLGIVVRRRKAGAEARLSGVRADSGRRVKMCSRRGAGTGALAAPMQDVSLVWARLRQPPRMPGVWPCDEWRRHPVPHEWDGRQRS